ncbi:hypothetical protein [Nocardia beijingensis]|uniref:hypothetical protein n=1 Tax=Nocardia beijingensis TaxID=95162 RepID=UPI0012F48071|nr:hypothetical protein [Nocardia beijingensis]
MSTLAQGATSADYWASDQLYRSMNTGCKDHIFGMTGQGGATRTGCSSSTPSSDASCRVTAQCNGANDRSPRESVQYGAPQDTLDGAV